MRILATISDLRRVALVLDLETGELDAIPVRPEFIDPTVQGRSPCRPFGITWTSSELFIANNRQLLAFDRQLRYLRTEPTPLQINTHQLAFHGTRVWAVSPWTNSLIGVSPGARADPVEFDLIEQRLRPYTPRDAAGTGDRYHFNSLLWAEGSLFVAAHNLGRTSFILRCDAETLEPVAVQKDVGIAIHGLALDNGELFWISTRTREIRSSAGRAYPLPREGYARGFAMTAEHFIVGISEFRSRDERREGNSWVQVIDRRQGALVEDFQLPDTGCINDLRLLDAHDYAHWIEPLYSTKRR